MIVANLFYFITFFTKKTLYFLIFLIEFDLFIEFLSKSRHGSHSKWINTWILYDVCEWWFDSSVRKVILLEAIDYLDNLEVSFNDESKDENNKKLKSEQIFIHSPVNCNYMNSDFDSGDENVADGMRVCWVVISYQDVLFWKR